MSPDLRDRIVTIVSEALDVSRDRVYPHSTLVADLGAESIDFLDILFRVESAFGLKIPEHDLWKGVAPEKITVQTIVDYLEREGAVG